MLTLEINGQFVVWPEEFAQLMMKYYRNNGVHFIVHRNCVHSVCKTADGDSMMSRLMEFVEGKEYSFCCSFQQAG